MQNNSFFNERSKIQEKTTAMGNPIIRMTVTTVSTHSGKLRDSSSIPASSNRMKAVVAYTTMTAITFLRLSS